MLPYWCRSSLIRTQVAPVSSERYTPLTPSTTPTTNSAMFVRPGAALPKPTLRADVTLDTFVNDVPEFVEWNRPVSPASQRSPSRPGMALNFAVAGSPVDTVCVNVAPPFTLT
jgi:hypothetical protein